MRALPADVAQRLGAVAVDLDPEHVEVGDLAQDLQEAFGLGVEVEVEQDVDVGPRAVADRLQMHAQVAQHGAVDVQLGMERRAEARPPAARLAVLVDEDVGLERAEALLAHLAADRLDAVEIGDGRLVVGRMIDAPGRAVRPVHRGCGRGSCRRAARSRARPAPWPWRRAARSRWRPWPGPPRRRRPAASRSRARHRCARAGRPSARPRGCASRSITAADAGRAEALVELAPADDAGIGRQLDEMVVAPARIADQRLDGRHLHRHFSQRRRACPAYCRKCCSLPAAARTCRAACRPAGRTRPLADAGLPDCPANDMMRTECGAKSARP